MAIQILGTEIDLLEKAPGITGVEKIPTGGRGLYHVTTEQLKNYILTYFTKEAINLGNVDNTSDMNKPVSKYQQAALNKKLDIDGLYARSVNGYSGDVVLKPKDLNLGNVNNTSDLNKPISLLTQAALDLKADKAELSALKGLYDSFEDSTRKALENMNIDMAELKGYIDTSAGLQDKALEDALGKLKDDLSYKINEAQDNLSDNQILLIDDLLKPYVIDKQVITDRLDEVKKSIEEDLDTLKEKLESVAEDKKQIEVLIQSVKDEAIAAVNDVNDFIQDNVTARLEDYDKTLTTQLNNIRQVTDQNLAYVKQELIIAKESYIPALEQLRDTVSNADIVLANNIQGLSTNLDKLDIKVDSLNRAVDNRISDLLTTIDNNQYTTAESIEIFEKVTKDNLDELKRNIQNTEDLFQKEVDYLNGAVESQIEYTKTLIKEQIENIFIDNDQDLSQTIKDLENLRKESQDNFQNVFEQITNLNNSASTALEELQKNLDIAKADITILDTAIKDKADSSAVTALGNQLVEVNGEILSINNDITSLRTKLDSINDSIVNSEAYAVLQNRVKASEDSIEIINQDLVKLSANIETNKDLIDTKASAEAVNSLTNRVIENETGIETLNNDLVSLNSTIDSVKEDMFTKASSSAVESLTNRVIATEGGIETLNQDVVSLKTDYETVSEDLSKKVDTSAFNSLSNTVQDTVDSLRTVNSDIVDLSTELDLTNEEVSKKASTEAVNSLVNTVTAQGDDIASLNADATELKSSLEKTREDLDLKADTSVVDTLTNRVTITEDSVKVNNSAITNLKADVDLVTTELDTKASVLALNNLTSKVESNEEGVSLLNSDVSGLKADLITTNEEVARKASSEVVDSLKSVVEQQGKDLAITNSDIVNLNSSLNSMVIGGGNLLKGTQKDGFMSLGSGNAVQNDVLGLLTTSYALTKTDSTNSTGLCSIEENRSVKLRANVDYVVSFLCRGSLLPDNIVILDGAEDGNLTITDFSFDEKYSDTTFTRIIIKFKASADKEGVHLYVGMSNEIVAGSWLEIAEVMFQEGTKPTNWGKSYLDELDLTPYATVNALAALTTELKEVDDKVTINAADIVLLDSSLEKTIQDVATKASTSALDSLTTEVKELDDGLTTTQNNLTALRTDITNELEDKASTSAVTGLSNRVTTAEGSIETINTDLTELKTSLEGVQEGLETKASSESVAGLTNQVKINEEGIVAINEDLVKLNTDISKVSSDVETKASADALASLTNEVKDTKDGIDVLNQDVVSLNTDLSKVRTDLTDLNKVVESKAETKALEALTNRVVETEDGVVALNESFTQLDTNLSKVTEEVNTKVSSTAFDVLTNRVTENESGIDTINQDLIDLSTSIDNVVEGMETKASAEALNAITNRVTVNEGNIQTQNSDITNLKSSVNTVEEGLATKAETAAVNNLMNRVTEAEGSIKTQNADITELKSDIVLITEDLETKASTSAVSSLEDRVELTEEGIKSVTADVTELTNQIEINTEEISKKASSDALSALGTTVTEQGGLINAQASDISNLYTSISEVTVGTSNLLRGTAGEGFQPYTASSDVTFTTNVPGIKTYVYTVVKTTTSPNGIQTAVNLRTTSIKKGFKYRLSFLARGNALPNYVYLMHGAGATVNKIMSAILQPEPLVDEFQLYVFEATSQVSLDDAYILIGNLGAAAGTWFDAAEVMLYEGNAINTWSDSYNDLVDLTPYATVQAVSQLATDIEQVDGRVTTNASDITLLKSNVASVEGALISKVDTEAYNGLVQDVSIIQGEVSATQEDITRLQTGVETITEEVSKKANTTALDSLTTEVSEVKGQVNTNVSNITKLGTDLSSLSADVETKASNSAVSQLQTDMTEAVGRIESNTSDITKLNTDLITINEAVETKASTLAVDSLTTRVLATEDGIETNTSDITKLNNSLAATDEELTKKASAESVANLSNTVTNLGEELTVNSSDITKLTNELITTNEAVASKASTEALANLSSTVTELDGSIQANVSDLSNLKATLSKEIVGGSNLLKGTRTDLFVPDANANLLTSQDKRYLTSLYKASQIGSAETFGIVSDTTKDYVVSLKKDVEYTLSFSIRGVIPEVTISFIDTLTGSIKENIKTFTVNSITEFTKEAITFTVTKDLSLAYLDILSTVSGSGYWLEVTEVLLQEGNKPTAWLDASQDLATAEALAGLSTTVSELDGVVKLNAADITNLNTNLSRIVGNNLVPNSSFEDPLETQWFTWGSWIRSKNGRNDTYCLQSSANTTAIIFGNKSLVSGRSYKISLYYKKSSSLNKEASIQIVIKAGNTVLETLSIDYDLFSTNFKQYLTVWSVPEADVSNISFELKSANRTAGSVYVDDLIIEDITELNAMATSKADASAVQALTTAVTDLGDGLTSVSNSVTDLNNSLSDTNDLVSTKASAEALESLSNTVSNIDGIVKSNSTDITSLQNDLSTTNQELSSKASASAVDSLTTRVSSAEETLTTQTSALTVLTGSLETLTDQVATKVDSSVLVDYYTKDSTDSAIAGKLEEFNTNLITTSNNLLFDTDKAEAWDTYLAGKTTKNVYLTSDSENTVGALTPLIKITWNEANANSGAVLSSQNSALTLYSGKSYTLTWKAVLTGTLKFDNIQILNAGNNVVLTDTPVFMSDLNMYSLTFTLTETRTQCSVLIGSQTATAKATMLIYEVTLTEGKNKSNWSPNPLQVSRSIVSNTNAISGITTSISDINNNLDQQATSLTNLTSTLAISGNNFIQDNSYKQLWESSKESTQTGLNKVVDGWLELKKDAIAGYTRWSLTTTLGATKLQQLRNGIHTISFDAYVVTGTDVPLEVAVQAPDNPIVVVTSIVGADIQRYSVTLNLTHNYKSAESIEVMFTIPSNTSAQTIRLKNIQLEMGSIATAYNPASEDSLETSDYYFKTKRGNKTKAMGLYLNKVGQIETFSRGLNVIGYNISLKSGTETLYYKNATLLGSYDTYVNTLEAPSFALFLQFLKDLDAGTYISIVGLDHIGEEALWLSEEGLAVTAYLEENFGLTPEFLSKWRSNFIPIVTTYKGIAARSAIEHYFSSNSSSEIATYNFRTINNIPEALFKNPFVDLTPYAKATAIDSLSTRLTQNENDITATGLKITSIENEIALKTVMSRMDYDSYKYMEGNEGQLTIDTTEGRSLLSIGSNLQVSTESRIRILNNTLYRLRIRFKQTAGPNIRLGAVAFAEDGVSYLTPEGSITTDIRESLNTWDSTYTLNQWTELEVYFKGLGTYSGDGSIENPYIIPKETKYISLFISTNNSKLLLDYFVFESADGSDTINAMGKAVQTLDNTVSIIDGQVENNSQAITDLTASLETTNTELEKKATTEALNSLNSTVSEVDGRVSTNTSDITKLSTELSTIGSDVAKKANISALEAVVGRVEETEEGLIATTKSITDLENSLTSTNEELEKKASTSALSALDTIVKDQGETLSATNTDLTSLAASIERLPKDSNLIPNGSAEDELKNQWISWANWQRVNEGRNSGWAYKATASVQDTDKLGAMITESLTLSADRIYRLSLYVKKDNLTMSKGSFSFQTSTTTLVELSFVTDEIGPTWSKLEVNFTPETNVKGYFKLIGLVTAGSLWVDDIAVEDITESFKKADSSALTLLSNRVEDTEEGLKVNNTRVDELASDVSLVQEGLETKASNGALSALRTDLEAVDGAVKNQAQSIVDLNTELESTNKEIESKASGEALNTLGTKVTEIDGVVQSTTESILKLSGSLDQINDDLETKVSTSVLSGYYTKDEADKATASKTEELSASLTTTIEDTALLGGTDNLWIFYESSFVANSSEKMSKEDNYTYSVLSTAVESGPSFTTSNITPWNVGEYFVLSFVVTHKAGTLSNIGARVEGLYPEKILINGINKTLDSAKNAGSFYTPIANSVVGSVHNVTILCRIVSTAKALIILQLNRNYTTSITADIQYVQLERGKIGSSWRPSSVDVSKALSDQSETVSLFKEATAESIQGLTNKVSDVEGVVKSSSTAITDLQNELITINGELSEKANSSAVDVLVSTIEDQADELKIQNDKITDLQSDLSTVAGDVALKANTQALDTLTGRVEKTEEGIIAQTKSMTDLSSSLSNMSVGGSNMMVNTEKAVMVAYNASTVSKTTPSTLKTDTYKAVKTAATDQGLAPDNSSTKLTLRANTSYVISIKARGSADINSVVVVQGGTSSSNVTLAGMKIVGGKSYNSITFVQMYWLFTPTLNLSTASLRFSNLSAAKSTWFEIGEILVQEGTTPTNWIPSALDSNVDLTPYATSKALETLETNVAEIDGRVVATSKSVLDLQSAVEDVEGALDNKVSSSALVDYYTKAEADKASAGKIEEYSASLSPVINALVNNPASENLWKYYEATGSSTLLFVEPFQYRVEHKSAFEGVASRIDGLGLEVGNTLVLSFKVQYVSGTLENIGAHIGGLRATKVIINDVTLGSAYHTSSSIIVPSDKLKSSGWSSVTIWLEVVNTSSLTTITLQPNRNSTVEVTCAYSQVQLESGTIKNSWSPSPSDVEYVNANLKSLSNSTSQAVQRIDASLDTVQGEIKAQAQAVTELTSVVDGKASTKALENYYTKAESNTAIAGKVEEFSATLVNSGNNLLFGTESSSNFEFSTYGTKTTFKRTDENNFGYLTDWYTLKATSTTATAMYLNQISSVRKTTLAASKTYTLSWKGQGSVATMDSVKILSRSGAITLPTVTLVNNGGQSLNFATFKTTAVMYDVGVQIGSTAFKTDQWFSVADIMLIEGAIPSTWSANAKEINTNLASAATGLSELTTTVSNLGLDIKAAAKSTTDLSAALTDATINFIQDNSYSSMWLLTTTEGNTLQLTNDSAEGLTFIKSTETNYPVSWSLRTDKGATLLRNLAKATYTLSFEAYMLYSGNNILQAYLYNETTKAVISTVGSVEIKGTTPVRYKMTLDLDPATTNASYVYSLVLKFDAAITTLSGFRVRNLQLERGNVATPYRVSNLDYPSMTRTYTARIKRNAVSTAYVTGFFNDKGVKLFDLRRGFNLVAYNLANATTGAKADWTLIGTYDVYTASTSDTVYASLQAAMVALPVGTCFSLIGMDHVGTAATVATTAAVNFRTWLKDNTGATENYLKDWVSYFLPVYTSVIGATTGCGDESYFSSTISNDLSQFQVTLLNGLPANMFRNSYYPPTYFATASAVSTLTATVSNNSGAINSQSTQITDLQNEVILGKSTSTLDAFQGFITRSGTQEPNIKAVTDSRGGQGMYLGNNLGNNVSWVCAKNFLSINPKTLYKVSARFKITVKNNGTVYIGVACRDKQGSYITTSNTLSVDLPMSGTLASGLSPAQGEWYEGEWYIKGIADSSVTGSGTIEKPLKLPNLAFSVSPMIIANYSAATGAVLVDYVSIEAVSGYDEVQINTKAISTLTSNISTANGRIDGTVQSITDLGLSVTDLSTKTISENNMCVNPTHKTTGENPLNPAAAATWADANALGLGFSGNVIQVGVAASTALYVYPTIGNAYRDSPTNLARFPVQFGDTFLVEGEFYTPTARVIRLSMDIRDESGTNKLTKTCTTFDSTQNNITVPANTWTKLSGYVEITEKTARTANAVLGFPSITSAAVCYIRNLRIRKFETVESAIQSALSQRATVKAVDELTGYYTQQGLDIIAATKKSTDLETKLQNLRVGSNNLLVGTFKGGFDRYSTTLTFTENPRTGLTNTKSYKVVRTTANSICGITTVTANKLTTLEKDKTYTLAFLARGSFAPNYTYTMGSSSSGSNTIRSVQTVPAGLSISETNYQLYKATFTADYTAESKVGVLIGFNTSGAIGTWLEIADVRLVEGEYVADWDYSSQDQEASDNRLDLTAQATSDLSTTVNVTHEGYFKSQASQMTNIQASIDGSEVNLLVNPVGALDGETFVNSATLVSLKAEDVAKNGNGAKRIIAASSLSYADFAVAKKYRLDSTTQRVVVTEGDYYLLEAQVYSDISRDVSLYCTRYNSSSSNISTAAPKTKAGNIYSATLAAKTWTKLSGIFEMVANTTYAIFTVRCPSNTTATTLYIRDPRLSKVSLDEMASTAYTNEIKATVDSNGQTLGTAVSAIEKLEKVTGEHTSSIEVVKKITDGVQSEYMVRMNADGTIGSFGMIQKEGTFGNIKTVFGVTADSFFIGAPTTGKRPFMVNTTTSVIDGITYPQGTWINSAFIANASITSAQINSLEANKIVVPLANPFPNKVTSADVTITGSPSPSTPAALFDGLMGYNVSFCTFGAKSSTDVESAYVQVDLKSIRTINEVRLWFYQNDARSYQYKVKYSENGTTWNYMLGNASTWLNSSIPQPINGSFKNSIANDSYYNSLGISCRYIRVYGNGNTVNTSNHLTEIEISSTRLSTIIDGNGISTNSVTADKLQVTELSAITANMGTIQVGTANIADAAITNAKIKDLSADKITAGTIDAARIRIGSSTSFDSGYNPVTNLAEAKNYVDTNTGNLVNNVTMSGDATRWTAGVATTVDFKGETVNAHLLSSSGNVIAISDMFPVDISKAYEVSLWVKKSAQIGQIYFGVYVYDSKNSRIGVNAITRLSGSDSSVSNNNPYFVGLSTTSISTDWVKLVGYVMPLGTAASDMAGIGSEVTSNFRFLNNAKSMAIRFLNYSNGGTDTDLWVVNAKCVEVDPTVVIAASAASKLATSKSFTYTSTPTPPYNAGDIWKDGTTVRISTTARSTYSANDWVLVGDITANNTAADSLKLGGTLANTVITNASTGASMASDILSDLVITPVEKTALYNEYNRIKAEYTAQLAQATALSITTTSYTTAYNALDGTAPKMSTILSSMTTSTTVTTTERNNFRTQLNTYYSQATTIAKSISTAITDRADSKAKTFTATPTTPYSSGDIWKDGVTIKVSTVNRASTATYTAADWVLVGDITANNTAADSAKLGGTLAATVINNATAGANIASDILSDLVVTPVEKTALYNEYNRIKAEYTSQLAQATALGVTTTAYTTAYTAIDGTAPKMSTILASMTTSTTLTTTERNNFRTQLNAYYTQATTIVKAITTAVTDKADSKAKTFTATPTVPYTAGDIWKDGSTIKVSTVTRASTATYTAADWVLVGDITANNTSADSLKLGGTLAATVINNAATGSSMAADILSDLVVTPVEKTALYNEWNRIKAEYTNQLAQANTLSITTTSYTNAYNAIDSTAPKISTILSSMTTSTTLTTTERNNFRTQLNTYYTQATAMAKSITTSVMAKAEADTAAVSKEVATALSTLDNIASDTIITPVEKKQVKTIWDSISVGNTNLLAQATKAGVSSSAYTTAYNTLNTYVTSLLSNMNTNSTVVRNTFNTNFSNVYTQIAALEKLINDAAFVGTEKVNSVTSQVNGETVIEGGKIRTNTISADKLSVTDLSAITANLGTISVGTANIATSAITNAKIGALAVNTAEIANGAITNAKIASLAVGSANIANAAITTAKIGDLSVSSLKIADNAVTIPATSYSASAVVISSSTWTDVVSLYVEASEGQSLIMFNTTYNVDDAGGVDVRCRILRGSAIVRDEFQIIAAGLVNGNSIRPSGSASTNYLETGKQNATITVQFRLDGGPKVSLTHRSLTSLVVKK